MGKEGFTVLLLNNCFKKEAKFMHFMPISLFLYNLQSAAFLILQKIFPRSLKKLIDYKIKLRQTQLDNI